MILGHKRVISSLNAILANGAIPHAFLFHGPQNVGKLTIAKEFVKALFCEQNKDKDLKKNCGSCSECGLINDWRHGQIIFLEPGRHISANKGAENEIGVNDVREIKRTLNLKAPEGKYNVVVVNAAEYMTQEAQNSLLKIIEEPGENTVFILISENPDLLLPTIASRCFLIRFPLVSNEEVKNFLSKKNLHVLKSDEITKIAYGRPGVIISFLENEENIKTQLKKLKTIKNIFSSDLISRFNYAEELSREDNTAIKEFFNYFYLILRDIFLKNIEQQPSLLSPKHFIDIMKSADEISNIIYSTNVNRRLALEALFLKLE